jgi:L-malate glycosyltransferase
MVHLLSGSVEWRGGGWESRNRLLRRLGRPAPRVERWLLRLLNRSSLIVVMGSGAAGDLRSKGIAAEKIVIRPGAVDPSRFGRFGRFGRGEQTYDVVTVTRLEPHKRVQDVLVAATMLRRAFPGLRVAVAGEGPSRPELEALARRLRLDDIVDFLGFVDDVAALYQNSAVFALASETEGVSIAVAEAMMSELPVVSTPVGDNPDLVVDGVTGFLIPVGDTRMLADRVGLLLRNEAALFAFGARARSSVQSSLSLAAARRHYSELLSPAGAAMSDHQRSRRHATRAVPR